MSEDITPIRQQYLEIKKQYPEAILLFRLGDFYETFDEDAIITSRELDIILTSRPVGKGIRVPLAGIPFHALDNYLSRLVEKGYHVAICEQVGEQPQKGIFPRQVVRVITPGTILESNLLKGGSNNYLLALLNDNISTGIAYIDISTGEFATTIIDSTEELTIKSEISRLNPAEIIYPEKQFFNNVLPYHYTSLESWRFDLGRCTNLLLDHFNIISLNSFGLEGKSASIQAAGALLQYVKEKSPNSLQATNEIHFYNLSEFMVLDSYTRSNLELTESFHGKSEGSLLSVIDKTITNMGKRLLLKWINQPLLNAASINSRLDSIQFFIDNAFIRVEFRSLLKEIKDLERLIIKVQSGSAQPRDLIQIRSSLKLLPQLEKIITQGESAADLNLLNNFSICSNELSLLLNSISENPPATTQGIGFIKPGYSEELNSVIKASQNARDWISNFEHYERQRTGIKTLKVGFNKIYGYYIEITHSNNANPPAEYIRKQTLVNAERYITPELKEYESLVLNAEERIHEIELSLFKEICNDLSLSYKQILLTSRVIGLLDVFSGLAEISSLSNFTRPILTEDKSIEIKDGRHPVVEIHEGKNFVPNDINFESGEFIRVITGPNMSGKSTYLRQTALIILLAQMGCFVPASFAKIGMVDRIFTRIGAQDEIHSGQSTFMVEMIETSNILHNATEKSVLILDEIGRGTSTYDGVSIAWSVIEFIHNHPKLRSRTFFATHYHELTKLSDILPGVRNYNVAVTESDGSVIFLHRIIPGGSDRSYGIHVAQLAGLPSSIILRANQILHELELTTGRASNSENFKAKQAALFPETNPILDEIESIDINSLSPVEALNTLYELQMKYKPRKIGK